MWMRKDIYHKAKWLYWQGSHWMCTRDNCGQTLPPSGHLLHSMLLLLLSVVHMSRLKLPGNSLGLQSQEYIIEQTYQAMAPGPRILGDLFTHTVGRLWECCILFTPPLRSVSKQRHCGHVMWALWRLYFIQLSVKLFQRKHINTMFYWKHVSTTFIVPRYNRVKHLNFISFFHSKKLS